MNNQQFNFSFPEPGQEQNAEHDPGWLASQISRREFVTTVGMVAGGVALHVPYQSAGTTVKEKAAAGSNLVSVQLKINGEPRGLQIDPRVTLLDLLRNEFQLTGTKKGCDHGQCGACTVLASGRRINSCLSLAVVHDGDEITTIEGLARGKELHPVQAAFVEHDGFQCGYCTPGQICSVVGLLEEHRRGDASFVTAKLAERNTGQLPPEEIRERMSGNICRCGAYPGILSAIQAVQRS
jgi:xanthine dehydrogenase YagT iron-sulfur-binding subunit